MKKDLIRYHLKQNYYSYLNCQLPLDLFIFSQAKIQQIYQRKQAKISERNMSIIQNRSPEDKVLLVLNSNLTGGSHQDTGAQEIFQRVKFNTPSIAMSKSFGTTPATTKQNSPRHSTTPVKNSNPPANTFNFSSMAVKPNNEYQRDSILFRKPDQPAKQAVEVIECTHTNYTATSPQKQFDARERQTSMLHQEVRASSEARFRDQQTKSERHHWYHNERFILDREERDQQRQVT